MKKVSSLLKIKYILLVVAVITMVSCASTAPRKCNGSMGKRTPMGVM